jgi:hypothetical protein
VLSPFTSVPSPYTDRHPDTDAGLVRTEDDAIFHDYAWTERHQHQQAQQEQQKGFGYSPVAFAPAVGPQP